MTDETENLPGNPATPPKPEPTPMPAPEPTPAPTPDPVPQHSPVVVVGTEPTAPPLGAVCTFACNLFGHGDLTATLMYIRDRDPDCVLYEFIVQGKAVCVRRDAIKFWSMPAGGGLRSGSSAEDTQAEEPTRVLNENSFTEFLFDKVFKMKERGEIGAEDPVYRFAKNFYQNLGWPIDGDSKERFREFITAKLYRECHEYPSSAIQELIDLKNYELMTTLLNNQTEKFVTRLQEIMYVLDLAWSDYTKTLGFKNPEAVIGSAA